MDLLYIVIGLVAAAAVGFAIAVIVIGLRATATKPDRAEDIRIHLEQLLRRGLHGSYMIAQHKESEKFIQIKKYFEDGGFGIEMAFPYVEWSKQYYKRVWMLADELGFEFSVAQTGKTSFAFLYVDFKSGIDDAQAFCERVIYDIFLLDRGARFDISVTDLVGKDYPTIEDHPKGYEFYQRHGV